MADLVVGAGLGGMLLSGWKNLLEGAPRRWLLWLFALMLLSTVTEGVGLVLLVPLLGLLSGETVAASPIIGKVAELFAVLGLPLRLEWLLQVFVGLIVLRSAVQHARDRLGGALQHRIVDQLRERCFSALLGVEWRWVVAGRKSDYANLLLTDVSRVGLAVHFSVALAATLASGLAYLGAAFSMSWMMTLVALVSGGLVFVLFAGQRKAALLLGQRLGEANRSVQANVQESLAGLKLTKISGSEARHLAYFRQTVARLRDEQLGFLIGNSRATALFQVGGAVMLAAYLYVGIALWQTPLAELLVLVLIFSRLIPLLMTAHQQLHHCLHAQPALCEVMQLLADCQAQAEPPLPAAGALFTVNRALSLKNVTVKYQGREQPALAGVSLVFPARTTTAIIGASGAGKSTLADVLMGLLLPDAGELQVDDVVIDARQRLLWRRSVAYVPQEVFLFNDSVRNNLLWANHAAIEADLVQALQRAAAEFVFALPQGLDTVVGDGGVRLSGGERQRLALARALLQRPALLILDEATSALDLDNEARVREAIESLHHDLTVVIIGHRLPTLEHADQVVVLDSGRVLQQGSWAQLRAEPVGGKALAGSSGDASGFYASKGLD